MRRFGHLVEPVGGHANMTLLAITASGLATVADHPDAWPTFQAWASPEDRNRRDAAYLGCETEVCLTSIK